MWMITFSNQKHFKILFEKLLSLFKNFMKYSRLLNITGVQIKKKL